MVIANLVNQFENWVRDASLTANELQAALDISAAYTAFVRGTNCEQKAA